MAYFYSPATIEGSFEIRLTNLTGQVQTVATGASWITPPAWSPQGDMTTSPSPADSAQSDIPNAARIYSYTLGGTHYFPVDQAAAEYMFSLVPSTPKWVRMLRAFLQHAARQLWAEGFTHFVDFASGLPTEDHIHHVLPDAKIVYSDSDPATYVQAKAMVGHLPNVLYLQHDVRDARSLLESAQVRNFLGGERKVAIGLSGITVFLLPDEISQIFHDLSAWAAPGAKLYVTYETKLPNLMTVVTTSTAATTSTVDVSATPSTTEDTTPTIVAAANAFLATLSDTERDNVLFDWTDNTQKQRWSNLPEGLYERAGLMWGDMSETQQNAWLALMQATLSAEGYNRIIAEWNADDVLVAQQGGGGGGGGQLLFGTQYYWIALIGTPSETEPWLWQWGGHHVTVNATIVGSNIALTPSFIGCQPCEYTDANGNTVRPLGDIEDEAFALVNALDATQQQAAILGSSSIDLVLGPGQDGKIIQSEGLPAAQMTADQQAALLQLIGHYTGLVNDEDAATRNAEVEATLDETYLAWYGPTTAGSAAYFRITGPTIVIEYSPQSMGGDAANHIHGIYSDTTNEYGATLMQ